MLRLSQRRTTVNNSEDRILSQRFGRMLGIVDLFGHDRASALPLRRRATPSFS